MTSVTANGRQKKKAFVVLPALLRKNGKGFVPFAMKKQAEVTSVRSVHGTKVMTNGVAQHACQRVGACALASLARFKSVSVSCRRD